MKVFRCCLLAAMFAAIGANPGWAATRPASDLTSPDKRRTTVAMAERLTRTPAAAPLPAELPQPFNPVDFNQPDPEELRAAAARAALAAAAANPGPAGPAGGPSAAPRPLTDRETLEAIAAKLVPSGTIIVGGSPRLIIGRNRFEVGTHFTVTYNTQDYDLELVSIDRTTFTLRLHREEITRPIKPGKSQ